MSRRDRDAGDALAEMLTAMVVAVVGLIIGLFVAERQKQRQKVVLPETLETERVKALDDPSQTKPQTSERPLILDLKNWKIFQPERRKLIQTIMGVYGSLYLLALVLAVADGGSAAGPVFFGGICYFPLVLVIAEIIVAAGITIGPEPAPTALPAPKPLDLPGARLYTISLPRSAEWQPELAYRFVEQILHRYDRLTFRIVAEAGQIAWQIVDLRLNLEPSALTQAVHASYPDAEIKVEPLVRDEFKEPFHRYVLRFKQAEDFVGPIRYVTDIQDVDPLVAITQEMSSLGPGERIIYTLFVSGFADFAYEQGEKLVTKSTIHPLQFISIQGWVDASIKSATQQDRDEKYVPADQKVLRGKLSNPLYQALLFVEIDASTQERVIELSHFDSHVWQFVNQPYNALVWDPEPWPDSIQHVQSEEEDWTTSSLGLLDAWLTNQNKKWQAMRLILEPRELASLWHLPHRGFTSRDIHWATGYQIPAPEALVRNEEGVVIGDNQHAGRSKPVRLPDASREAHMNIVGKTGVGKSTLMHNLIHQDIEAGKGVGVIDPHGMLVEHVLRCSIPDERVDDVVVLDIANEDCPPPLNPLALPDDENQESLGQVVAVLDKFGSFEGTATVLDTLSAALYTLWYEQTPTVRDVPRLLTDGDYRSRLVQNMDDVATLDFWREFQNESSGQQRVLAAPVIRRIRSFYRNKTLHPILCHPDAIDFVDLIRSGKILLVSLQADQRKVPKTEQRLLGAVLVSQLQMAAMASMEDGRSPFYLYIDEVQNFVTTSLDEMFEEARKFGLHLTVGNQRLGQLKGDTLDAVMGTVGATIVFEIGADTDARLLAPHFRPEFDGDALRNLGLYTAAVKMRLGAETLPAFSLKTRPDPGDTTSKAALAREGMVRQRSSELYTPKSREEVLAWLEERYPRPNFGASAQGDDDWVVPSD